MTQPNSATRRERGVQSNRITQIARLDWGTEIVGYGNTRNSVMCKDEKRIILDGPYEFHKYSRNPLHVKQFVYAGNMLVKSCSCGVPPVTKDVPI